MLKKKDPYIDLLDIYYEKFPESLTLQEVFEYMHKRGHITEEELEVINAFGKTRDWQKNQKIELSASRKRSAFELMFTRAGDSMHPLAARNAPHIMNSAHYFHRLDYKNIMEAHKSSRVALLISLLALLISVFSTGITWISDSNPTMISDDQIKQITNAMCGKDDR